jgi:hypothetical protein
MDINVAQVLVGASVSLLVGAVSAWVAGTLGVRQGVQRAQRERAFDRRLTWFEDAIRVTFRFKTTVDLMVIALRETDANKSLQIMESVVKNSEEVTQNLAGTINKSLVYSSREVYLVLKKMFAQVMNLTVETSQLMQKKAGDDNVAAAYESQSKLLEDSFYLLATTVRDLLKMDKIRREDFDEDFGAPKHR